MPLASPVNTLRRTLRGQYLHLFERAFQSDEGRSSAIRSLRGLLHQSPLTELPPHDLRPPYDDLGQADDTPRTCQRDDVIFITARFRSGSTLLWNLFRHAPGCTAYYEPLNERQWFDPVKRGSRVDSTHRDVDEYWREYDGLLELGDHYREDWIRRHLWMDADFHDPALQRYVEILIERSPGRPVLQFNRIDFRLPWFRRRFPNARIVHLCRHPRDQWLSSLGRSHACSLDARLDDFEPDDQFYLLPWLRDLSAHFPFLDDVGGEHPYRAFYLIWKLSWMAGTTHADHSLAFEHLVQNPRHELEKLLAAVRLDADPVPLVPLIQNPGLAKWKKYASQSWFQSHESAAEETLRNFFQSSPAAPRQESRAQDKAPHR